MGKGIEDGTGVDATVRQIRRTAGLGGHITYEVDIRTRDGVTWQCAFNGNLFVGPVLVFSRAESGRTCSLLIHRPRRFGEFATEQWVHRFFAEWHEQDGFTEDIDDVSPEWLSSGWRNNCG
jgi:hypothetical protein